MSSKKIYIFFIFILFSFSSAYLKLVEIIKLNPNIVLDIRYATKNNFTGQAVYPTSKCYLEENTAKSLLKVQNELESLGLGLKIFDGYRPLSVQKIFWSICPDQNFVMNPRIGSKHNRGTAVDLTLIDLKTGKELPMPSQFDDFSKKARRDYSLMSPEIAKNCKLLTSIMEKHNFKGIKPEWWHFDFKDWKKYPILDLSFADIEKKA